MGNLSINSALNGATGSPGKVAAEAVSAVKSVEAQVAQPIKASELANFVTSPKGVFDPESGLYLLQYRDQSTGQVTRQYPSEKVVDAYKKGMATDVASSGVTGTAPAPSSVISSEASAGSMSAEATVTVSAPSAPVSA